jgi:hypothetical protein
MLRRDLACPRGFEPVKLIKGIGFGAVDRCRDPVWAVKDLGLPEEGLIRIRLLILKSTRTQRDQKHDGENDGAE